MIANEYYNLKFMCEFKTIEIIESFCCKARQLLPNIFYISDLQIAYMQQLA